MKTTRHVIKAPRELEHSFYNLLSTRCPRSHMGKVEVHTVPYQPEGLTDEPLAEAYSQNQELVSLGADAEHATAIADLQRHLSRGQQCGGVEREVVFD